MPPLDQYPAVEPFGHGVASGEPATTSVLVWTQLTGPSPGGPVSVAIAADPALTDVFATGVAEPDAAGTIRLTVDGLVPGREWYFRFDQGGAVSPTGRTITLPDSAPESFVVAVASCQHYEEGFFTALGDMADAAPDLVVHLGDFVYARRPAGDPVRTFPGGHGPIGDDASRVARYDGYLRDPHLQRARAAAPWIAVWDDNELRGDGDAVQAWRDHMPVSAEAGGALHRSVDVGDLARIVLLDARAHRDPPVCDRIPGLGVARRCDALADDRRTMLGGEQETWLAEKLGSTTATWNLVADQVVVTDMSVDVAGVSALNDDQWDGYPAARRRLLAQLGAVPGAVVLSGDLHCAGLSVLRDADGEAVGHEVLGPSISSVVPDDVRLGLEVAALGQPDLGLFDTGHRGWVRLDLGRRALGITYRRVDALDPDAVAADGPVHEIRAGAGLPPRSRP